MILHHNIVRLLCRILRGNSDFTEPTPSRPGLGIILASLHLAQALLSFTSALWRPRAISVPAAVATGS